MFSIVWKREGVILKKDRSEKKSRMKSKVWVGSIATALLAAVVVFAVMLQIEREILTQYEKGDIYVATRQIPKGQLITKDNYRDYLELRQLDKNCIPKTAIHSVEQIQNLAAVYAIDKDTLLSMGMFESINDITKQMREPIIAGFKADDVYQVVGGVLRAGDRIHIYSIPKEEGTIVTWQDVFVQQVFDATGQMIPNENSTTAAQRINIYLEKNEVEQFYTSLQNGLLRVVKVNE